MLPGPRDGPAAALRAILLGESDGPLTALDVAEATGTNRPQTARKWCHTLEAHGLASGQDVETAGRPARAYVTTEAGRAALGRLAPCDALAERRRRANAAARAGARARDAAMTKRPPLPVEVEADAAAGRAARRRVRCHPPTVAKRHTPPTIAATPAELAAALVPSAPPDVPAWLEDMGAGMDAADALATVTARGWTEPPADSPELPAPAVDPDARTLDAGAILEAAAELDAEPSEAAPKAIPPAMPPPAVERAAATREASRADAPAPVRAWACHCGKASVGPTCWGCGLPRERGERVEPAERRPPLTVLPGYAGGRPPDPVRVAALAELASSDDELAAAMAAKRRARLRLVEANGEPSA